MLAVFTEIRITCDGKRSAFCFDRNFGFEIGEFTVTPFEEAPDNAAFRDPCAAHPNRGVAGLSASATRVELFH